MKQFTLLALLALFIAFTGNAQSNQEKEIAKYEKKLKSEANDFKRGKTANKAVDKGYLSIYILKESISFNKSIMKEETVLSHLRKGVSNFPQEDFFAKGLLKFLNESDMNFAYHEHKYELADYVKCANVYYESVYFAEEVAFYCRNAENYESMAQCLKRAAILGSKDPISLLTGGRTLLNETAVAHKEANKLLPDHQNEYCEKCKDVIKSYRLVADFFEEGLKGEKNYVLPQGVTVANLRSLADQLERQCN